MSDRIEGSLEAVIDGRAIGWAWDPESPDRALEIEVLVDGRPAATGIAEVERQVLADAGIGTGRYGFDVALPEQLSTQDSLEIQVNAGPDRMPVSPFDRFDTVSRFPDGPWAGTTFVAKGGKPPPKAYVPEEEDPVDPGRAALVGSDGWLFLRDDSTLGLDRPAGAPLLSSEDVESRAEAIVERYRRFRELRIPYLFAAAPMKERSYPDQLPDGLALPRKQPVRQLNAALNALSGAEIVDLQPALLRASRGGRAFPKTDSNWSDRGAFFAYRELMREAAKRVVHLDEPLAYEDASFAPRPGFRGDLAGKPKFELRDGELIAAADGQDTWEEEIEAADVSKLRALRMPAPDHLEVTGARAPHLYEIPDETEMPRAVLVGDSSCLALIQWLAEHFRRFVFLWAEGELPLEAIELEAPDVLIHVVSERRLVHGP